MEKINGVFTSGTRLLNPLRDNVRSKTFSRNELEMYVNRVIFSQIISRKYSYSDISQVTAKLILAIYH